MVRLASQPASKNFRDITNWGPWAAGVPLQEISNQQFDFSPYEADYLKNAKDKGQALQHLLFQRMLGSYAPTILEPMPDEMKEYKQKLEKKYK